MLHRDHSCTEMHSRASDMVKMCGEYPSLLSMNGGNLFYFQLHIISNFLNSKVAPYMFQNAKRLPKRRSELGPWIMLAFNGIQYLKGLWVPTSALVPGELGPGVTATLAHVGTRCSAVPGPSLPWTQKCLNNAVITKLSEGLIVSPELMTKLCRVVRYSQLLYCKGGERIGLTELV